MSRKVILTEAQFRDYMRFQLKENNNKQINTNKNMKINESQLRNIIKESIKNILKESDTLSYDQELQPGWYVCIEGNYGDVSVWVTDDLNEVREVLDSSESNVMGPYNTEMEANEVADQETEKYGETNGFYRSDNKLTESKLRKIIKESINGILNEITSTSGMGWMGLEFEEDDWIPVNEPNEGDVCYKIKLWCGSGYHLDAFKVYAQPNDYETALEILVAYFDRKNINTYFVDNWIKEEMENLREKGVSDEDLYEELSKDGDYYIDATMEGASKPHWLRGENLQIQAFPLKENIKK